MYTRELRPTRIISWCLLSTVLGPIRPVTASLPLPPDWDTLCPYTDFCTHKAAKPINLTRAQKPCCEPCSCEPDCGLRRNCCHYSMDRYRIDENYYIRCKLLSTALDNTLIANLRTRNYYMSVDRCPNKTSCYNFRSALWGSLFPVFSHDTHTIYINKACASCHKEQNVTEFVTELNCPSTDARTFFHGNGLTNAINGNPAAKSMCYLTFFPPEDADVDFHNCFNDLNMQRTCEFESNTTDLLALCESFNATFSTKLKDFANIYCYVCNKIDGISEKADVCAVKTSSRTTNTPFSALLETDLLRALERQDVAPDTAPRRDVPDACRPNEVGEGKTGKCRRLRCKLGQIDMAGKCEYLGSEWTVGPFQSFIKLEALGPGDRFPVKKLDSLSLHKGPFFKKHLATWDRWLYHMVSKNESFVAYFVLRVYHKKDTISPIKFLDEFQWSLEDIWSLSIGGNRYRMKASFHKYQDYFACDTDMLMFRSTHPWTCIDTEGIEFDEIHSTQSVSTKNMPYEIIPLTKFFFCDQVALNHDEYIDQGERIYFRATESFLEELDFRRVSKTIGCDSIIVCVSDFEDDFWKIPKSVAMAHSMLYGKYLALCLLFLLLVK